MAGYERGSRLEKVLRCTNNVIYDLEKLTANVSVHYGLLLGVLNVSGTKSQKGSLSIN
jgi:hypothetical protein